ncbi:MAG TPA: hypothetical protein VF398_12435 [bacterium]|jgi:hypothetical protein
MTLLTRLGVLEIAFSTVLLPLFLFEGVERRFPGVLKDRRQLLSAHLDYFFMGILLILSGTVLQPIPNWIAWPLIIGSLCNPTVFLINSFAPDMPKNPIYRVLIFLSCATTAWAWAAIGIRAVM